jgi:hypothetical protein
MRAEEDHLLRRRQRLLKHGADFAPAGGVDPAAALRSFAAEDERAFAGAARLAMRFRTLGNESGKQGLGRPPSGLALPAGAKG